MNIQQQCLQTLHTILTPQGNENVPSPVSAAALESFYQTIADERFAFYPEIPPLPMAKSLLWNHDSLRSEVKNLFQVKVRTLWDHAEVISKPAATASAEEAALSVGETELAGEGQPAVESEKPISPTPASAETDLLSKPRKPDAFDRLLDMIAVLVKGITFSIL